MFVPSYLATSRHGVFYFRWPLPVALHPQRKSLTLKISLLTRDPYDALRWSRILSYVGQRLTSYGVAYGMTFEEVRRLLSTHFSQLLAQKKAQIAKNGRLSQLDISVLQNGRDFAQEAVQEGLPLLTGGDDSDLITRFIDKYELRLQTDTPEYANLNTELKRAYRDYCSSVLDYDRSLESYQFAKQTDATQTVQSSAVALPFVSLRELADRFTNDSNLGGQWVSKTQNEKADHISLLTEVLNANTDVATITPTDAQRVKDTLVRYPKNRKKDPRTRELPLHEALSVEGVQIINVQTINKYLRTYGAMFRWAKHNGYIRKNVFEGLSVRLGKKQKGKTVRTAFTEPQVQIMLQELLHNSQRLVRLPYQKWGPLIALYSGARLNEIAQIHLTDIRQEEGIWCFDLNDDDETKTLKTDASRRLVPIHSRLIELGLLDHVQALRASGVQKLFQDFRYCPKNGWGRSLGRWFNDQFLVKLGMKAEGVSFHLFRHTVISRLMQAEIETPLVQTIVGHERQGVTHQHYFKAGYKISQRRDALEKLSFNCTVLPEEGISGAGKLTQGFSLSGAD